MYSLLIFDFDGLILDTETPDYISWCEFFAARGAELNFDVWATCIGERSGFLDLYAPLEKESGQPVSREELRPLRRARFYELLDQEELRPGVLDYLDAADRLGIRLAVASSSRLPWIEKHLTRFGIFDRFECIRTRDDVSEAKPSPEVFQAVIDATGVPKEEALVLEDSPNGVLAAKRAGLTAVAVPNSVTARLDINADLHITSMADMPLERLLEVLSEKQ